MRYQAEIETRPHPPTVIPWCEMILPIPREWFDFINAHSLNATGMLEGLLSHGRHRTYAAELREDFLEVFEKIGAYPIPRASGAEIVRVVIPLRVDIFECLEAASRLVGKSVHEVACRILARQIPVHAEIFADRRQPIAPRRGGKAATSAGKSVPAALAGKIIPFRPELAAR